MNKQSNLYTILYSSILVILVGAGLALVYGALKPQQDKNIAIDKQKQILSAARLTPATSDEVEAAFAKHITESFIVNCAGEVKSDDAKAAFEIDLAKELKKGEAERQLPVFVCTLDGGEKKFIVPTSGAGLWGAIWGYVALDSNCSTIYGTYYSHASETPGLGARIEEPAFQDEFAGKNIFKDGQFLSVSVMKKGKTPTDGSDYVDAISGATITSRGVGAMLLNSLGNYKAFFEKYQVEQSK